MSSETDKMSNETDHWALRQTREQWDRLLSSEIDNCELRQTRVMRQTREQ